MTLARSTSSGPMCIPLAGPFVFCVPGLLSLSLRLSSLLRGRRTRPKLTLCFGSSLPGRRRPGTVSLWPRLYRPSVARPHLSSCSDAALSSSREKPHRLPMTRFLSWQGHLAIVVAWSRIARILVPSGGRTPKWRWTRAEKTAPMSVVAGMMAVRTSHLTSLNRIW